MKQNYNTQNIRLTGNWTPDESAGVHRILDNYGYVLAAGAVIVAHKRNIERDGESIDVVDVEVTCCQVGQDGTHTNPDDDVGQRSVGRNDPLPGDLRRGDSACKHHGKYYQSPHASPQTKNSDSQN